jgi:hypothetical protein
MPGRDNDSSLAGVEPGQKAETATLSVRGFIIG